MDYIQYLYQIGRKQIKTYNNIIIYNFTKAKAETP